LYDYCSIILAGCESAKRRVLQYCSGAIVPFASAVVRPLISAYYVAEGDNEGGPSPSRRASVK
jgi:hypothetical protein